VDRRSRKFSLQQIREKHRKSGDEEVPCEYAAIQVQSGSSFRITVLRSPTITGTKAFCQKHGLNFRNVLPRRLKASGFLLADRLSLHSAVQKGSLDALWVGNAAELR